MSFAPVIKIIGDTGNEWDHSIRKCVNIALFKSISKS